MKRKTSLNASGAEAKSNIPRWAVWAISAIAGLALMPHLGAAIGISILFLGPLLVFALPTLAPSFKAQKDRAEQRARAHDHDNDAVPELLSPEEAYHRDAA